jgi:hypothetical protein
VITKYSDEDESAITITERWARLVCDSLERSTGRVRDTHSSTLGAILESKDETKEIKTKEHAAHTIDE